MVPNREKGMKEVDFSAIFSESGTVTDRESVGIFIHGE
jgi:hypothetical protein